MDGSISMSWPDRILIIANPTSGRGRGKRTAEVVETQLRAASLAADTSFTEKAGDAARFARQACVESGAVRTIVACGGDGTVQEIAAALAKLRAEGLSDEVNLALAPAGRCNDFARALGVPRHAERIVDIIRHGRVQPLDLGKVNDRFFCTVATLGLDAEVTGFVDRMRMPLRGTPAYLYGALRVLMRYRPQAVKISGDFATIEKPVFIATTANTALYGGAIPIVPHALPTDGLLDLCVIDAMPLYRALPFIPQALFGRHIRRREVQFIATRQFRMESATPLELWADGERIGKTPAEISVAPGIIRVLCPTAR